MRSLFAIIVLFFGLSLPALAADQPDAVSEFYAGHAALQQNDPQEAIEHFSKALQLGKLDQTQVAYVHHYRAIAYQRLDRQQEAIDDYTQALAIGSLPQRVQAAIYYNRAIALDHLANFDRAIKDYSQAITLKPDYAEAYMNRGNAYRKLGDNDAALKDYEASASYGNPIKHLPYYGEGLVLEAKGDKPGAYKAFQTALLLAPDFEPAKLKIQGYQAAGIAPAPGAGTTAAIKPATPGAPPTTVPSPSVVAANAPPATNTVPAKPGVTPPAQAKPVESKATDTKPAPPQSVNAAPVAPPKNTVVASASPPSAPPVSLPKAPAPAPAKPAGGTAQAIAPPTGASSPSPINSSVGGASSTIPAPGPLASAASPAASVIEPKEVIKKPEPVKPQVNAAPVEASSAATKPGEIEVAEAAVPAVGPSAQSAPSAPVPAAASVPKPVQQASTGGAGSFLVQVGAYTSEDQAHARATTIVGKHADLLTGLDQDIQRADLGAKGIYYRLRFGPFGSRKDASDKCSALKSVGQDCVVVTGAAG